jgi:ABC-type dipeptide/oligopeptide/nickel transport system permease subunit
MSEMQVPATAPIEPLPGGPGADVEREFTIKERKQWQMVLIRFLRHRAAVVSLVVLILVILVAFVGPLLWKYDYTSTTSPGSSPPTLNNPLGTDQLGHDLFAQVMRGAQQSLRVAFIVAVLSTGIGAPYGAISGYYGGKIDTFMMRICDVLLVLPVLAIAGAIVVGHGGSVTVVALVLGLLGWVVNARVVRGVVLSLREQEFVEAARALGGSTARIVFRHLLPNVTGAIIVQATLDVAGAILGEAALSFVGIGVQPPDISLGVLVNFARTAVDTRPWLFYFPGLVIIIIALTVNFIGDGLRDAFDPRQTRQRR